VLFETTIENDIRLSNLNVSQSPISVRQFAPGQPSIQHSIVISVPEEAHSEVTALTFDTATIERETEGVIDIGTGQKTDAQSW